MIEIVPPKGNIALSHSRLSDYNQCPRKFYVKYIAKAYPEQTDSPHLIRGSNVHKALENYIIAKKVGKEGIPPSSMQEVELTKPFIDAIMAEFEVVHPEIQLAVDKNFKKVEWFAKDAYWRSIIDFLALNPTVGFIGDFKTGKMSDYSGWGGQLHLSAAMILSVFPTLEKVNAAYIYVDHKQMTKIEVTRDEVPKLLEHYEAEMVKVNSDGSFMPKTNDYCKWCECTLMQCQFSRKL